MVLVGGLRCRFGHRRRELPTQTPETRHYDPMRLFAAIVPPLHVLEEVDAVVQSAHAGRTTARPFRPPGAHAEDKHGRRSLLDRLGTIAGRSPDEAAVNEQLVSVRPQHMHIPITYFGNLTLGDSVKLADALRAEAATWRRPELRFAGGTALEWPGDESVWTRLAGDVEDLLTIGRGIPVVAQRMQLFVDRRQFRPWLSVGTITDKTTAPYLEDLVARLERFKGRTWVQESVTLLKGVPHEPENPFELVEELPLSEA